MTSHNAAVISRPKIGISLSVIITVSKKPFTYELSLMHRLGVHFRSPVSTKISKRPLSIFPSHLPSLFQRGREWIWINLQMEAWERRRDCFSLPTSYFLVKRRIRNFKKKSLVLAQSLKVQYLELI